MLDLQVIDRPDVAATVLDPLRCRLLAVLTTPGSATTVAAQLGVSRQKANYHVRALEHVGLLVFVEHRQRRGLTERVVVASARSYLLSPEVLGATAPDPARTDRLSSRYLLAVASRLVSEVAGLVRAADRAQKPLATLTIDVDIRFASAEGRAVFTAELADAVNALVARYHDESAPTGRWHRLIIASHPAPTTTPRATHEES